MKNVLIIGMGEIGTALYSLIEDSRKYQIYKKDLEEIDINANIDIMHICIPYTDEFVDIVRGYVEKFKPKLIIINSTVRPGTTQEIFGKCKISIVHSPVRGKHPNIKEGLLLYKKYIGPIDRNAGENAKNHFETLGVKTELFKSPIETELAKILSTSYYGLCIAWHQEMERICKKFNADFDQTVTEFNKTYNDGIKDVNPNLIRPIMYPGFIGGHCVMPNLTILQKDIKSDFIDAIVKSNEKKKNKK